MKHDIKLDTALSSTAFHKVYDSLMGLVDNIHVEAQKLNEEDETQFTNLMNLSSEILDFADQLTNAFYSKRKDLN